MTAPIDGDLEALRAERDELRNRLLLYWARFGAMPEDDAGMRLLARHEEMKRELELALELIEGFQSASGLCVPAEEKGGDPGGVRPHHVEKFIAQLQQERDEHVGIAIEMEAERDQARRERDEAREWVRRLTASERVLTCVYCGHAYPPGSPWS